MTSHLTDLDSLLAELDTIEEKPKGGVKPIQHPPTNIPKSNPQPATKPSTAPNNAKKMDNTWEDELDNLVAKFEQEPKRKDSRASEEPSISTKRETVTVSKAPVPTGSADVCGKCGQSVSGEHILALGKIWHTDHFTCDDCGTNLKGDFYETDGRRVCKDCTEKKFNCDGCKLPITAEYLLLDNKVYHEGCLPKNQCAKCRNPISGSSVMALDKHWHQECFTCLTCGKKLGESFYIKDNAPQCEACTGANNVGSNTNCVTCGKQLSGSYVAFQSNGYHPDCFVCAGCHTRLPHDAFYNKNGKPHCRNCVQ
eukprot:TRINITY_DN3136_c0_g1_i1.p1 TRINITY_DN3136_c0_g1~~TRINITY_DN3136_c0_g1_i1.p1  ORF type:complete len:310 (-),score=58.81 TRINITY_DN3136_c0_g1_i1:39-968(-)